MRKLTPGSLLGRPWGWGDNSSAKGVNQLVGECFVLYDSNEEWNVVYVPRSFSGSWYRPQVKGWAVPRGGGVRRLFEVADQKMGFQTQVFGYLARKNDSDWELRVTIELLYA